MTARAPKTDLFYSTATQHRVSFLLLYSFVCCITSCIQSKSPVAVLMLKESIIAIELPDTTVTLPYYGSGSMQATMERSNHLARLQSIVRILLHTILDRTLQNLDTVHSCTYNFYGFKNEICFLCGK